MKKKVLTSTLIIISSLTILLTYKKEDNITFLGEVNNNSNLLSIMLETSSGSYEASSQDTFPTTGYTFNESLSGCENGGKLSYDSDNKKVIMVGNSVDKCYAYFDVYEPTLAETIINQYTGVQGENGLYYHDSNLTNGANDNSYRYAGANPNNYVCFGSDESTCPNDNLYRIIGIFDGRTKLIKYDYPTTSLLGNNGDTKDTYDFTTNHYKGSQSLTSISGYYWNYNANNTTSNTWSTSLLNKTNLNTNYLNNIGTKWADKIDTVIWKVGGNTTTNIAQSIPSIVYQNEIVNPVTTNSTDNATEYSAKIGLMYVSDYGFAALPSSWTITLYNYGTSSTLNENWMYMGLYEWTISRNVDYSNRVFFIIDAGYVNYGNSQNAFTVRPVFYLNSSVVKTSGDGTKTNPYRIS